MLRIICNHICTWKQLTWSASLFNRIFSTVTNMCLSDQGIRVTQSKKQMVSYRSHVTFLEYSTFSGVDESPPYCPHSQAVTAVLPSPEMLWWLIRISNSILVHDDNTMQSHGPHQNIDELINYYLNLNEDYKLFDSWWNLPEHVSGVLGPSNVCLARGFGPNRTVSEIPFPL